MIQIAVQSGLILQLCPLISDTSIMAVQHHNNFYVLDNESKVASKEKKILTILMHINIPQGCPEISK